MSKFLISLILLMPLQFSFAQLIISEDFPGGNILIDSIKGNDVWLQPNQRETDTTNEKWFYWNFKITGAENKNIIFHFNHPYPFSSRGPAYSKDKGVSWNYLFTDSIVAKKFDFSFSPSDSIVQFAMAIPYTELNFQKFLPTIGNSIYLEHQVLCVTPKNRKTELLHLLAPNAKPQYSIVITARHHACEMRASDVVEGLIIRALELFETSPWFRNNCELYIIPFMDKDGVEDGLQGKLRLPHDHNRDYIQKIYCSTKTLTEKVPEWTEGKKFLHFDIHCPWILFDWNERIFIVGKENPMHYQEQQLFAKYLQQQNKGELSLSHDLIFPFGTGWNTSPLTNSLKNNKLSSSNWSSMQSNNILSASIEFPYVVNKGQVITQANSKEFGIDLMNAIDEYLTKR